MDLKLIALDLDGTVLHSDKSISEHTVLVLDACRRRGIKIAVATARSEPAAKRYVDVLRPDAVISNGGSLARVDGRVIHRCMLSAATADRLAAECMGEEGFLSVNVETESGCYATWEKPYPADYEYVIHCDFKKPLARDTYKLTAELTRPETARRIAGAHPECGMLSFSDGNFYRYAHKDSTKLSALRKLAEYLDLELSQVAAFGDDHNDLEMIRACGVGVAMGNAITEVKAAADVICGTNDEDGVAGWLGAHVF